MGYFSSFSVRRKMELRLFVCLLLVAAINNYVHADDAEAVIALQDDTFDAFVASNDFVLAEFYAPWCGHCKSLAPEYEKAAKELLALEPTVYLVKVDATQETAIAGKFEVSGYPTLKFFRKGNPEDYEGPRDAAGIVEWCKEKSDPNYKPPPESVVTINNEAELDEFVKSAELTLVEFYAPWCGHCKQLAPEYEKAAKDLLSNEPAIRLAKIDAVANKELSASYDLKGFPTLFMFRAKTGPDGEVTSQKYPYDGPRDYKGIVTYMKNRSGPPAVPVNTLKEIKNRTPIDDVIVVGMFSSKDVAAYSKYQESVEYARETYSLQYTTNADIRAKYGVTNQEAMVVIMPELMITKHDKPYQVLEIKDDTETAEILGFIDAHGTPLIGTRSTKTKERYVKRPLCVLFVPVDWSHEYREMTASWRDKLLPIANRYRKDFHFAMSDDEANDADIKSFGFDDSGSDFSIGCYGADGNRYPMEELDEWDQDEIEDFLDRVKAGKVKSHLKSQIPPKKQSKPVVTVVGKTFEKIVKDHTKDVLIELYAPWCGHCKKFAPEYEKLAKSLSSEKHLVIAKMNADANDSPENYNVMGYPTIYFAPANKKQEPIKYSGEREIGPLRDFMTEHAEVSLKKFKDEL